MPLSDELEALAIASAMTLVAIAAMFVPIWYFERRQGASTGRYTSRSFVHDVAYSVFYASGLSNLIGTAWLASGAARLEFLDWKLLAGLPTLVAAFLFWILSDLFLYWVHRAQHAIPWLWRLHSIHHTAESLTFVTAHRVHPAPGGGVGAARAHRASGLRGVCRWAFDASWRVCGRGA